jgi:hypothetical protein
MEEGKSKDLAHFMMEPHGQARGPLGAGIDYRNYRRGGLWFQNNVSNN